MQLKTILNHVEKQSGFVYSQAAFAPDKQSIMVEIAPRAGSRAICSGCGKRRAGYDRLPTRKFEFVPLWGIPVFFLYAMRRVDCPECGKLVERVPWADGKHHSTYSYRLFLAIWAKRLSWKETSVIFGTSWDTVSRRLKAAGEQEILKHSRWCLLKSPSNLTARQALKLTELVKHNLRCVRAYLMREDFQRFWEYESPAWAGKFLDQWCTRAMRSKIEPMKEMARTLRCHRPILLNWFRARGAISNGSVKGMNNKAKLAIKKAYGFKSYTKLETALYHQLGKLPEPKRTHEFC